MKEDITRLLCEDCKKLPDECDCDAQVEEPEVQNWDDITNTWARGELSL